MSSFDDKAGRRRPSADGQLVRSGSYSPTATLTSHAENLTFVSDSEAYDAVPALHSDRRPKLIRSTTGAAGKHPASSKWGYGWGVGKQKQEKKQKQEIEPNEKLDPSIKDSEYERHPPTRHNSKSSNNSKFSNHSKSTVNSKATFASKATYNSQSSHKKSLDRSDSQNRRPALYPSDSTSTLVGSAYERKVNDVETIREKVDTTERLEEIRKLMAKDNLDY
jgi:Xaa-Pro aminopeptidase